MKSARVRRYTPESAPIANLLPQFTHSCMSLRFGNAPFLMSYVGRNREIGKHGKNSRSASTMGRCTCTSSTPRAPNVIWSVPTSMVSMIFWHAEDTGCAAGAVSEHRVKGLWNSLTRIPKFPSCPESESADLDDPTPLQSPTYRNCSLDRRLRRL